MRSGSIVFALFAVVASAGTVRAEQSCVLTGAGHARVAATVATPGDCCTGRMECARFLSTTVVVRPAQEQRT